MPDLLNFNPVRALDLNGDSVSGAQVRFYKSGTSIPITVYADEGTTAHPSPLVANSEGIWPDVYYSGDGQVKAVVTDADDASLYEIDPVRRISTATSAASGISFSPTEANDATDVQGAIANVDARIDLAADQTRAITGTGGLTGGGDLSQDRTISADFATQAQAEAGTNAEKVMSPQRTRQAIFSAIKVFSSDGNTYPAAGSSVTVAHGFTGKPDVFIVKAVCATAEQDYAVGDEVVVATHEGEGSRAAVVFADSTNIGFAHNGGIYALNKSTPSTRIVLTEANWTISIRAMKWT